MIEIHAVTIDAADPYEIASWWSRATGLPLGDDDQPGDEVVMLRTKQDPYLLFIRVPEGKAVKNRLHLDVNGADGRTRDQEVERMIELGATVFDDLRNPDGTGWVVMLDPEGNDVLRLQESCREGGHGTLSGGHWPERARPCIVSVRTPAIR